MAFTFGGRYIQGDARIPAKFGIPMNKDPNRKHTNWRKEFWITFLAILVTLIASILGLIFFHFATLRH